MSTASSAAVDPRHYQAPPDALRDRVILVTGAGDGIGRAVALALAAHSATVVLSGRTVRKLEKTYDEILAQGSPQPSIAPLDLEKVLAGDYDTLADALARDYGRLDGLLHNAGLLGHLSPIEHYDVPTWVRVMHVNVNSALALTQVCIPLLKKSKDAAVVFTSSNLGRRGRAFWGAYAVSKFAIEGLSQVLADELQPAGVRVNCLNPVRARTNMRMQAYPAEDRSALPEPETLVRPYLYLLGPASRGVTGQSFDCQ
jgi:NAD(P)-dependent dehydrogenase (short-subunit alcohol dehydrogenase family)